MSTVRPSRLARIFRWRPPPTSDMQVMVTPDRGKHGLGIARPVGLQHGQGLHLLHGEQGGVLNLPVDLQGGDHLLSPGVLADDLLHPGPEGGDVLLPEW